MDLIWKSSKSTNILIIGCLLCPNNFKCSHLWVLAVFNKSPMDRISEIIQSHQARHTGFSYLRYHSRKRCLVFVCQLRSLPLHRKSADRTFCFYWEKGMCLILGASSLESRKYLTVVQISFQVDFCKSSRPNRTHERYPAYNMCYHGKYLQTSRGVSLQLKV